MLCIIEGFGGCASPEPSIVYRTQRVLVETQVPCKHSVVEGVDPGSDLAPSDSDYYETVQWLVARIYALRSWAERLENSLEACDGLGKADAG